MPHSLISFLIATVSFFGILAVPVMAAGTSDDSSTETAAVSGYDEAKALIDAANYSAALPKLESLTKAEPDNADAWNLLGFTQRMLGDLDASSQSYLVVLKINPDHLGALEYQGELFIKLGKLEEARANLVKLQGLCGTCEEFEDLDKALKAAGV